MTVPVLPRLAAWVANLEPRHIPPSIVRAARLQVLNMVAAVHAAAQDSAAVASIDPAVRDLWPGAGRATALGSGRKCGPVDAALANCAHSMAQDFDDIVWMGHTGHSAVFASLAVAETEGRRVEDLLTAVVVANEVGGRLGASSFLGPLNGQMWSFVHLAGAAAAAAKLLGLGAEQTANALAIALAQPTFALAPAFFLPTSKLLTAATPTAIGIQAAYFARRGMTGAPNLVEDKRGFWSRFSYLPLPFMMGGLGELWTTGTLSIKTYPGCHYFQTACSAIERLLARHPALACEDVESILVQTSKLGAEVTRFAAGYVTPGEIAPVNVNFDLALCAAILFHARRLGSKEVETGWLAQNAAALRRWRARIRVAHDPAMTLKVLQSAQAVSAGREALGALRLRDLPRLLRRYSAEYRSSLLGAGEVKGWLSAVRSRAHRGPFSGVAQRPPAHAVPLFFPGRVRVVFKGGAVDAEELDLPEGSLASPAMEERLRQKFFAACAPRLGAERAQAALAAGLSPDARSLQELVALLAPAAAT